MVSASGDVEAGGEPVGEQASSADSEASANPDEAH